MGDKPTIHTAEQLAGIAQRVEQVTAAEDYRITGARKTLAAARHTLSDDTTPYTPEVWAGRLQANVTALLAYIDEQTGARDLSPQLDRIENAIADLRRVIGAAVVEEMAARRSVE